MSTNQNPTLGEIIDQHGEKAIGMVFTADGVIVHVIVGYSDEEIQTQLLRPVIDPGNHHRVYKYPHDVRVLLLDGKSEKERSLFRWNAIAGRYPKINERYN